MGYQNHEDGSVTLDREAAQEVANLLLDAAEVLAGISRLMGVHGDLEVKCRLAAGVVLPF